MLPRLHISIHEFLHTLRWFSHHNSVFIYYLYITILPTFYFHASSAFFDLFSRQLHLSILIVSLLLDCVWKHKTRYTRGFKFIGWHGNILWATSPPFWHNCFICMLFLICLFSFLLFFAQNISSINLLLLLYYFIY